MFSFLFTKHLTELIKSNRMDLKAVRIDSFTMINLRSTELNFVLCIRHANVQET